jgi:hypothetical protein
MSPFLATVLALGGLAVIESLMHGMISLHADFLLLLIFACIAAPHTLNLGHNANISTLQPFILTALVLFGVREAVILAAVSMTYFWIAGRPRGPAYKAGFNIADFVLSAWIGGQVFIRAGGRLGDVSSPASLLGVLLATLAFFVVNTSLVSIAVGLEQGIHPFRVWYEKYSWTLNTQLAGGSLVILVGILRQNLGPQVFILVLPFCITTYYFYKAYFSRALDRGHKT